MKFQKIISVAVFFAACALTFSTPAVSDEMLADLRASGGRVEFTYKSGEKFLFALTPDRPLSKIAATTWTKSNPKFSTENLFLVKKSELSGETTIQAVSKIVRSISKMKGLEYYSNGDEKWETLYHKASVIKSPKDKTTLPDDTEGSADGKNLFCLLEDNSFGDCIYRVSYKETEDEVCACFENAAAFKVGPITAVKTGNLHINLSVTDIGEEFLVYMVVRAQYPSLPFLENRMTRSFNARVEAMFNWFKKSFAQKSEEV